MFYIVYKITNKINNKIYIGKHQTKNIDDDYMGSGKMLNRAFEKYGLHNFEKEILFIFDNELEMNNKESELVTEEFCEDVNNYNLCPGGKGGWGYVNQNNLCSYWSDKKLSTDHKKKIGFAGSGRKHSIESKIKISNSNKGMKAFLNKTHSIESRNKISNSMKNKQNGSKNSQFGTMWITNGLISKKIKNTDVIPEGWNKGRKIKMPS